MSGRNEYLLFLENLSGKDRLDAGSVITLTTAQKKDATALAELMIEAYRGTMDYDGESLVDAMDEVQAFLSGARGGNPLLEQSRLAFIGSQLASACLICDWEQRGYPIVAYVMTHPDYKGSGMARLLLNSSLQALKDQSYLRVGAVITHGNLPSERLFCSLGFRQIDEENPDGNF
ncbi:MAG: hypothetical protein A2Z16_16580 [Chloroflexi bacterium RBG_16_54_18]|nr:MAG: hypothetical protein A2Z16_16580 [Chloroflexi bacterium RBG_16_54_18]